MNTKVFEAKLDDLHEMLDFIKAYCKLHHIPPTLIEQIILAAEEALVNIISYSYQQVGKGLIDLSCGPAEKTGIKIIIKDRGTPFNLLENIPTTSPPFKQSIDAADNGLGGYGIYLLTKIMDIIEYQRIDDQNILTMIKYC